MKTGSITNAARLLNVSQPAVSMVLKHPEDRMRVRLFERAHGRLHATPEAHALYPEVEAIFSSVEALDQRASALREGRSGLLSLAAPPQLATAVLTRTIAEFCRDRPELKIVVWSAPTVEVIDRVVRQQADLGLVYAPYGSRVTDAEIVGATRIACAMHPDHPLASRATVHARDLRHERIISYKPKTPLRRSIEEAFRQAGETLEVQIQTSSLGACALAAANTGVALIDPLILANDMFAMLTVRAFEPSRTLAVQLIFAKDRPRSLVAGQFATLLRGSITREAEVALATPGLAPSYLLQDGDWA
jgi:DNA-binding transcriptional LysR family regulator